MPFDGTTTKTTRREKQRATAAQTALVPDMMEFFFRDGAMWTHHRWESCDGKRCLVAAMRFIRQQIGSHADRANVYLARAIHDNNHLPPQERIVAYNDAKGRTYPEIAALIHEAKALAEAN